MKEKNPLYFVELGKRAAAKGARLGGGKNRTFNRFLGMRKPISKTDVSWYWPDANEKLK